MVFVHQSGFVTRTVSLLYSNRTNNDIKLKSQSHQVKFHIPSPFVEGRGGGSVEENPYCSIYYKCLHVIFYEDLVCFFNCGFYKL